MAPPVELPELAEPKVDDPEPDEELPKEDDDPDVALPNPVAPPDELPEELLPNPEADDPVVELPLDVLFEPMSGICCEAFKPIPLANDGAAPPPPNPEFAALGSYLAPVLMTLSGS